MGGGIRTIGITPIGAGLVTAGDILIMADIFVILISMEDITTLTTITDMAMDTVMLIIEEEATRLMQLEEIRMPMADQHVGQIEAL